MKKGEENIYYIFAVIGGILATILVLYFVYKYEIEMSYSPMELNITASEIKGTFFLFDSLKDEIKNAKFCIPLKRCSKIIISSNLLIVYGLKKDAKTKEVPFLISQFGGEEIYYEGEKGLIPLKEKSLEVPCFIKGKPNYLCFNKVGKKIIIS